MLESVVEENVEAEDLKARTRVIVRTNTATVGPSKRNLSEKECLDDEMANVLPNFIHIHAVLLQRLEHGGDETLVGDAAWV
eukprot:CAMPEP_0175994924 /NCGR_PEP_ID=MMETSP0108-20121206/54854_1 /TAXON_ID=195067 ORGANISM="Goniomonas pacifica, Strain CCMP1869" /NCGR_SAMPLE_ID=MMETSP0108 /ASSEMBLY_ACC=CAM_ASM_000204 /LENGTH=80 /DNA_ID=CAMNT_0017327005 /DNA_START=633 /DNA_END=875 /DNA_ORIENTATION=-